MRGNTPTHKKLELSSGGRAPCSTGFPPLGECSRNLSVSGYQLALLWEAAFGFSGFFFLKTQCVYPFPDGWFTSAPVHTALSVQQFLPQNTIIPCLTLSKCHLISPQWLVFCFLGWKKFLKGKHFAGYGWGKTKNGRSTKRHQTRWVQKLFWAVEKTSQ